MRQPPPMPGFKQHPMPVLFHTGDSDTAPNTKNSWHSCVWFILVPRSARARLATHNQSPRRTCSVSDHILKITFQLYTYRVCVRPVYNRETLKRHRKPSKWARFEMCTVYGYVVHSCFLLNRLDGVEWRCIATVHLPPPPPPIADGPLAAK